MADSKPANVLTNSSKLTEVYGSQQREESSRLRVVVGVARCRMWDRR